MKSIQVNIVAILALTLVLTGYGQEPQDPGAKKWKVQAGWVHQFGRGMSVSGPAPSLSGSRSLLSGVGLTYPDNGAFIPRNFDDGYVHPDIWTGDTGLLSGPNPERYGQTWNWGAGADQYNYDGGAHPTLNYHIDRGERSSGTHNIKGGSSDDDYESNGVEVKARRLLHSWIDAGNAANEANAKTVLDLNLVVGLAWFPELTQHSRRAVGQDMYGVTESYTYLDYYGTSGGGSLPPLNFPYSGTVAGPGALIPVTPEASGLNAAYHGSLVDHVDIKSKMWHVRGDLGIEFVKSVTERLDVYVSPQIVLEFVDMDVERTETVTFTDRSGQRHRVASRTDTKHKTTVIPGALIVAGADYRVSERWYAGVSLGWEELVSDPHVRVGSDKVKYDLSGGEFSLYVGCRF